MSKEFTDLILRIEANDCRYQVIDFTNVEYQLDHEKLKTLNSSLSINNVVGRIKWPLDITTFSQDEIELKRDINTKVLWNLKHFKLYPTHYEYALLSNEVYTNTHEIEVLANGELSYQTKKTVSKELLKFGWEIISTPHEIFVNGTTGFYAALYKIPKYCQMVLAYRGSEANPYDFIGGDWKNDLSTIFLNKLEGQIIDAYESMDYSVRLAESEGYNLSFTGHSLGGWLANTNNYLADKEHKLSYPKSVTFDAPGIYQFVDGTNKPGVLNPSTVYNPTYLDITNYVSYPNLINSVHTQIGTNVLVFTDIDQTHEADRRYYEEFFYNITNGWTNGLWNIKEIPENFFNILYTVLGHKLTKFLPEFNSTNGYLKRGCEVENWPIIAKDNHGFYNDYIKKYIKNTCSSNIPYYLDPLSFLFSFIYDPFHPNSICKYLSEFTTEYRVEVFGHKIPLSETGPYQVANLLIGLKEKDIKYEDFFKQYASATERLFDLELNKTCEYHKKYSPRERMSMLYEGNLELSDLYYPFEMHLVEQSTKRSNYPNMLLKRIYQDPNFIHTLPKIISDSTNIQFLKNFYNIHANTLSVKEEFKDKDGIDVEFIKQYAQRAISLFPELKEFLDNFHNSPPKSEIKLYTYNAAFEDIQDLEVFIDRKNEGHSISDIMKVLENTKYSGVILGTTGGVGKTTLSKQLGKEWISRNEGKDDKWSMWWFDPDHESVFMDEILDLKNSLKIEVKTDPRTKQLLLTQDIPTIHEALQNTDQNILFIFDNYIETDDEQRTTEEGKIEPGKSKISGFRAADSTARAWVKDLQSIDNVKLLITSRREKLSINEGRLFKINLESFNEDDIKEYFSKHEIELQDSDWSIIKSDFSTLPLQIHYMAKYLQDHPGKNMVDLKEEMAKSPEACKHIIPIREINPLTTAMNETEKDILLYTSYLGTKEIPYKLLKFITNDDHILQNSHFLERELSLVRYHNKTESFSIHGDTAKLTRAYTKCVDRVRNDKIIDQISNKFAEIYYLPYYVTDKENVNSFQNFITMITNYVSVAKKFAQSRNDLQYEVVLSTESPSFKSIKPIAEFFYQETKIMYSDLNPLSDNGDVFQSAQAFCDYISEVDISSGTIVLGLRSWSCKDVKASLTARFGKKYFYSWHENSKNPGNAKDLFSIAAEYNNSEALYYLGLIQCGAQGEDSCSSKESINNTRAVELFEDSANLGNGEASLQLAQAYENAAMGLKENLTIALEWYNLAVNQKNAKALYTLGMKYRLGDKIVERNSDKALEFLSRSAHIGYVDAMAEVGDMYYELGTLSKPYYYASVVVVAIPFLMMMSSSCLEEENRELYKKPLLFGGMLGSVGAMYFATKYVNTPALYNKAITFYTEAIENGCSEVIAKIVEISRTTAMARIDIEKLSFYMKIADDTHQELIPFIISSLKWEIEYKIKKEKDAEKNMSIIDVIYYLLGSVYISLQNLLYKKNSYETKLELIESSLIVEKVKDLLPKSIINNVILSELIKNHSSKKLLEFVAKHSLGDVEKPISDEGLSPLVIAIQSVNKEAAEFLLEKGASVNYALPKNGNTALHYAADTGGAGIVQVLLANAADTEIINNKDEKPLDIAISNQNYEIACYMFSQYAGYRQYNSEQISAMLINNCNDSYLNQGLYYWLEMNLSLLLGNSIEVKQAGKYNAKSYSYNFVVNPKYQGKDKEYQIIIDNFSCKDGGDTIDFSQIESFNSIDELDYTELCLESVNILRITNSKKDFTIVLTDIERSEIDDEKCFIFGEEYNSVQNSEEL